MIRQCSWKTVCATPAGHFIAAILACTFACASTARAVLVTFQNGVSGYSGTVDNFIQQAAPATANGASASVEWDGDDPPGTNQVNAGLIRFDSIFGGGVGQVPVGSQITSATLTYTVFNTGTVGVIYEAASNWSGATTWATLGGTPGVDAADYGTYVNSATGSSLTTYNIDVTPSLVLWSSDPALNKGWIILSTGTDGVQIRSSEYAAITNRPKLTVNYGAAVPPSLVRAPYLQLGTPTSMTICWRTNMATDSVVHFGAAPGSLTSTVSDPTLRIDHYVTLSGLSPATTYYYDVGLTGQVLAGGDANHYLATSPTPGSRGQFSFWMVGDCGNGSVEQTQVRNAMLAVTAADPPDFWLHMGDIAYNSGTNTEFNNYHFGVYQGILRHTVCWPTLGNHEGTLSDSQTQTGPYYTAFVMPMVAEAGGLASNTEAYYSFDYANAHFICLDSHDSPRTPGSAMLTWLANDLAMTTQNWVIAYWHHPPYSHGSHDSDDPLDSSGRLKDMRENALPILEAGGVDLVLGGHSHIYERSYLVDGAYDTPTTAAGHIVDAGDGRTDGTGAYLKSLGQTSHEGAVYIVAGHGGAAISGTADHPLMYFSELDYGSCVVTIEGNVLSLANIRRDSVTSDHFTLIKTPPGDLDIDGDIDTLDVSNFVDVLLGLDVNAQHVARSDINVDSLANGSDIAGFVASYLANG
ncbi:MAG: metallophosphoesterase family protein [Planctomycetes bacterium]|nr:metallophosphoesterase family protein [Planctomycetota bacterium]